MLLIAWRDKWNIFILNDIIYFARSWTGFCIYKVFTENDGVDTLLTHFHVNRDKGQYNWQSIEEDTILLKKLLQAYLGKEDIYTDPKLDIPCIKKVLNSFDPDNNYKKSVGSNSVGLTKEIYKVPKGSPYTIIGWKELEKNIITKPGDEPLISVYVYNRKDKNDAKTYYFDKTGSLLLGEIIVERI